MLNKTRILALLLSILVLAGGLWLSPALAANAAALLTPSSQNMGVGQTTTVTLRIQDVENLYGYQAAVAFDPTVLEVVDADATKPGVQVALGSFLQADFVPQNAADNSLGAILCVVSQLAPHSAASGSGELFTITFRGKAQGASDVRFTDLKLAQANGVEISVTQQNAYISVGSETQPTSTFTPTPTATPVGPTSTPTATPVGPTPTPSATPSATPTSLPPGEQIIYVVRSGDTLYSIARRFGVSLQALAQVNNIANPRYIQVGQRLIIPRGGVPQPTPLPDPNPTAYVVQRGDTLYSIARRYGTTVEAIAMLNRIANPSRIYAGQRLIIPGGTAPTPPPSGQVHVVQRGETLYSIARRYGTTVWAIAIANHLPNPNVIYAGQRLAIP
jgi:LysM repeat protein